MYTLTYVSTTSGKSHHMTFTHKENAADFYRSFAIRSDLYRSVTLMQDGRVLTTQEIEQLGTLADLEEEVTHGSK